jgi:hypothetical protein
MSDVSTSNTWSTWSLSTKVTVVIGLGLAAALVLALNLFR